MGATPFRLVDGQELQIYSADNTYQGKMVMDSATLKITGATQILAVNDTNVPHLVLQGTSAGWASGIQFNNTTPTTGHKYGIYSDSSGNFHITDETGSAGSRLTIDSGGNVGVGASGPLEKLHIAGNVFIENGGIIKGKHSSSSGRYPALTLGDSITIGGGEGAWWGTINLLGGNGGVKLSASAGNVSAIQFGSHSGSSFTEKARMTHDGKWGLGVTAPDEVLEVAGNVKATTFKKADGTEVSYSNHNHNTMTIALAIALS